MIIKLKRLYIPLLLVIGLRLNAQSISATSIQDSEQARFEAQVRRDTALLRLLIDGSLTYYHSNGLVETKEEFIQSVGNGKIRYNKMSRTGEINIRKYGKTAVVTGIVAVEGSLKDKPFDISLRYTSVYLKQKKYWKLIAWQSTKL